MIWPWSIRELSPNRELEAIEIISLSLVKAKGVHG